nr:DUF2441 domain-containing protein [Bacilli bacterium]
MQVTDKEMYHFHNNSAYNDILVPNNEIIVDNSFNTFYVDILKTYTTAVNLKNGDKLSFDRLIDNYLERDVSKETLIKLLKEAARIIEDINICKRELALERVRETRYPDLPSRSHSIWLCDEFGLDFWKDALSGGNKIKLNLYKVSVTGNLFKSSDAFLPKNTSDYGTNLIEACEYWNPQLTAEDDRERIEYLFQGKLKILEKLDY